VDASAPYEAPDLQGRVCLVTGATRGAGLAIATALGACSATVYVTGRTTRATGQTEGMPGTLEDAAEAVEAAGGSALPVRCDHTHDADVEALARRIDAGHGHLHLLVNNAWGGYEQHPGRGFTAPLQEQPPELWERMFTAGVRAQLMTARAAIPLLLGGEAVGRPPLIVATTAWAFGSFLGNVYYDTAKAAINRLAFGIANELRESGVASVALTPGFMRTERVLAAHAADPFDLSGTESPAYLGRAVAALAADPGVMELSGDVLTVGELARRYGFTDLDGSQPAPFRLDR
jgi:NAD(P)-dependent dehydrogenase (short-subunit alcohol dehydrogenase family)